MGRAGIVAMLSLTAVGSCAVSATGPRVLKGGAALRVTTSRPPAEEPHPIAVPACGAGDLINTNDGVAVDLECTDGHRGCGGELPVAVRNCLAEPVRVSRLTLRDDQDAATVLVDFDPLPTLGPRAAWSHPVVMSRARELEVEVELIRADGTRFAVGMRASVRNPRREEAMARCRECNGDWGRHGLLGLEGCLCRTVDEGGECRDGRECEGTCLYERTELVRKGGVSCRDGYCNATLDLVVPVGRCSEFVTTFGCHHYLPDGVADEAPFVGHYSVPYRCCD